MRILTTAIRLAESARRIEYFVTQGNMGEEEKENWQEFWKLVLSAEKDLEHLKQSLDPVAPVSWR